MRADNIIRTLHSHTAAMVMAIVAVAGIVAHQCIFPEAIAPVHNGLGLPAAGFWFSATTGMCVNLITAVGIALLLCLINREFTLTRDNSVLFAGLFMLSLLSLPQIAASFTGGTLLTAVCLIGTFILFGSYSARDCSYSIFTIFMLLGLGAFTFYGYLFFVPVFIAGCMQMRILSLRTAIAGFLGLITPAWILTGFGLVSMADIAMPHIVTIFHATASPDTFKFLITAGFTVAVCLICGIGSIIHTYGYNNRSRSFNGFIYLFTLTAILAGCIDFGNADIYITAICCCAAYQAGHFFSINRNPRSLPGVLFIILAYIGLGCWNFIA